ncbi:acyl-ACP desaturase [Phycisphaerales bacterium AB-hyl4]|uniref:Acyl-ACP desaturase n=1 Tax=Natronomicrosphaera hydrolytica TaxID=3242702 RepID=A0ABV4U212_9BACT
MSKKTDLVELQREVLKDLEATDVRDSLSLLIPPDKSWQPTDYLPDLTAPDWYEQLSAFREPAKGLSDEVLVVLIGDMVTEEALPSYSVALNSIAQDYEGTSSAPWARWLRGWTAEENRHGDLLNAFLRLTGRVEMKAVERTVHHLLNSGFNPRTQEDLYAGLVYTAFQERATKISHNNVGKLAAAEGNVALGNICRRIAGDEARHEAFYTRMMDAVMARDPENGTITAGSMLRRVIAMPGRLMYDGKDPDLFDHFAVVAQRLGVYTVRDYASIVRHLVDTWNIADRALTGKAARAQEFLCKHAERVESVAEDVAARIDQEPRVQFSWIYDREA